MKKTRISYFCATSIFTVYTDWHNTGVGELALLEVSMSSESIDIKGFHPTEGA
jgi:hypothetical protein